ncbi:hypothetical protein O181_052562 [Austropuccinia psidii MF-1]|uniref:Uncharacterized protein n=1 Tax=Austropuccinia psidii MF-1 TaxID=1389203 RepID=A0A9Q3HQN3_9BASI|nr:hypothetical protein [Austropuccinia psidii MF-1]
MITPVQDPDSVHENAYACTGSQQLKPLLPPGKAPNNYNNSLRWCRLPTLHMQILTLVHVPNNSNNSLRQWRLSTLHTHILTLVKVPNNSENFLFQLRILRFHTQTPHACTGYQ